MSVGIPTEQKRDLVEQYRVHEGDTGSPEVQIALLHTRIARLTDHVRTHRKDHHTTLGLKKLNARQRRLLNYLKREDFDRYKAVTDKLKIKRR